MTDYVQAEVARKLVLLAVWYQKTPQRVGEIAAKIHLPNRTVQRRLDELVLDGRVVGTQLKKRSHVVLYAPNPQIPLTKENQEITLEGRSQRRQFLKLKRLYLNARHRLLKIPAKEQLEYWRRTGSTPLFMPPSPVWVDRPKRKKKKQYPTHDESLSGFLEVEGQPDGIQNYLAKQLPVYVSRPIDSRRPTIVGFGRSTKKGLRQIHAAIEPAKRRLREIRRTKGLPPELPRIAGTSEPLGGAVMDARLEGRRGTVIRYRKLKKKGAGN